MFYVCVNFCEVYVIAFFFLWVYLQETHEFRDEILKKLSKDKETFGDERDTVNEVCVEVIFFHFFNPFQLIIIGLP